MTHSTPDETDHPNRSSVPTSSARHSPRRARLYDPSAYRDMFESSFTYESGLLRNRHRFAQRTALSSADTGESWTYAQLGEQVDRIAGALFRLGIRGNDILQVELFNGPEFATLYQVSHRLRTVFSPTNFRLAPGEVTHILDTGMPDVLVYDTARTDEIRQALALSSTPPHTLLAVGEGDPLPGAVPFRDLVEAAPITPAELTENDAALPRPSIYDETSRMYTSGTTGWPKPVPLPSIVEVMSAHDVIMHFPLTPFDRTLNMTPLFHRGGLYSGGPNPVFYVGAEIMTLRHFDANRVLDLVEEHRLTYLIGAPTTLVALAEAQEEHPRDLASLHGIVTMGAPLDRAAALRFQQVLTPRIFNGYGTTETFWNTFLRPEDLPDGSGSAGRSSTDDDVAVVHIYPDRLAGPTDTVAHDSSEIGEFAVRTPKAGYSYLNRDLEERKFVHGWFFPGDLAVWDQEEKVTILGRKDDMIISGGENIHPVQVEAVLAEHPGVSDSIVIGVPDPQWGQLVAAYVVRDSEAGANALPEDPAAATAELERYMSTHPHLARYKRPRLYRFVDSIPYNATGKKVHAQASQNAAADAAAGRFFTA